MKKKILILGVTGQDGSLLAEFLINKNYLVYGLIRKSSNRNLDNLKTIINHKNFKLVQGDILDIFSIEKIIKQIKPNEICNFADRIRELELSNTHLFIRCNTFFCLKNSN